MGRPEIEITEELCKKAESYAAQGLNMEQIARVLGMGESTLYAKKVEYPEFLESIKNGQAKGVAIVTNALFNNAKDGNLGAQCFYLKNRAQWTDKTEFSGPDGGPIQNEIVQTIVDPKEPNERD